MWITDWTTRAACRGTDPDELFVQGAAQNRAKLICRGCPVRTECLADALDNGIEFGVWGGMTERERFALLRRRPDVRSWRELPEVARDRYERSGFGDLVDPGGPTPPAKAARSDFPADVSTASLRTLELVASLPETQRLPLTWAIGGFSPAVTANHTAQSLGTVRDGLRDGRAALKEALLADLDEPASEADDLSDADLDALLREVTDELGDAVEEAEIADITNAITASVRSSFVPADSGALRAIG